MARYIEVGDIVKVDKEYYSEKVQGKIGKVVKTDGNILCQFPDVTNLHDGDTGDGSTDKWWVDAEYLIVGPRIGDRVVAIAPPDGDDDLVGAIGTVRKINGNCLPYQVHFDNDRRWWCEFESLKVIQENDSATADDSAMLKEISMLEAELEKLREML